jgi:hypothetical protein
MLAAISAMTVVNESAGGREGAFSDVCGLKM